MACKQPLLNLKTRPRFRPVSLSLSMICVQLRLAWKKTRTNTLAYFVLGSVKMNKSYKTLTPGCLVHSVRAEFPYCRSVDCATTISIKTLSITTFSIMPLSTNGLFVTQRISKLSLCYVLLSTVYITMLNVIRLCTVAPSMIKTRENWQKG